MKEIPLDGVNTKLLGRALYRGERLWLTLSASGCEFTFRGKYLALSVGCDQNCFDDGHRTNKPRVAVIADGRIVVKKVIEERRERFVIIDSSENVTKTIRIVKLSEAAFSLGEVYPAETDDAAQIAPTAEKSLKIELIGDSITCGYGVDDSNMESEFATEAENAVKSYGYKAAQLLDADYSLFSYSGYGIISGYTPDGVRNTREVLPPWYLTSGFSYSSVDGVKLQDIPWDFSRFVPDYIVINLGTNDNSFCEKNEGGYQEFEDRYLVFLRTVRSANPAAFIICALGIMEAAPMPYIVNAVKRFGDARTAVFRFTTQDGLLGFGSNWHPSEDTQLRAGEELAGFISDLEGSRRNN